MELVWFSLKFVVVHVRKEIKLGSVNEHMNLLV